MLQRQVKPNFYVDRKKGLTYLAFPPLKQWGGRYPSLHKKRPTLVKKPKSRKVYLVSGVLIFFSYVLDFLF